MSYPQGPGYYKAEPAYAARLRAAGLVDGMSVFELPQIEVWRSITERENCVLDTTDENGATTRFHIKRNKPGHRGVDDEAAKIKLLIDHGVPTVPLAGYGKLHDGRGFLITDDLAGYQDAEKIVAADKSAFEKLLKPTAALAAKLHGQNLHHRDLYLCHFYVRTTDKTGDNGLDVRLMDAGRVGVLPRLFRRRWLVKDIAQFGFSLTQLELPADVFERWLAEYGSLPGTTIDTAFRRSVARKMRWIARHDASLRRRQPTRNVAIDR